MPALSVLIKPASGLCNMRCRYCFYADVAEHREVRSYGIMNSETTEALISRAFEFASGSVAFAFQGGEPTLAGEDYYRFFIDTVNRKNPGISVSYAMQTNGYNLTDGMCEILRDNRFLVGVSLDGTAAVHDLARIDAGGEGTFKKVSSGIAKLKEYGIDFNILTVVTENAARNGAQIYRYFRSRGYRNIQFIRHIEGFGEADEKTEFSLSPERYGSFLKTVFDLYYDDIIAGKYISVRDFDNYVMLAAGMRAECCGMNGVCPCNLVVEADGSTYPCDFYVLDEWKTGNVRDSSLKEIFDSERARLFRERSFSVDEKCRKCRYYRLCMGGCARSREPYGENGLKLNRYCESYKSFFDYAYPKIIKLASMAREGRIK